MWLLFLGQWEGQLDWKLLLAEYTLHYLFVCMFCFCFCVFFYCHFYIASSIVLSFSFSLYCNYNYKGSIN